MTYDESIPALVKDLWKIRDLLDTYSIGKAQGVSITKASFKTKINTEKGKLAAKLGTIQADITKALT